MREPDYTANHLIRMCKSNDGENQPAEFNDTLVNVSMVKSRTANMGTRYMTLGFVGGSNSDYRLRLMRYAKEAGMIAGKPPECYLIDAPDIKFDPGCIMKELAEKPELTKALVESCIKGCNQLVDKLGLE